MTTRPIRLFVVHADADDAYLPDLDKHLSTLQRQKLIDTWHQRRIAPGDDVVAQIDANLEKADIIILAVSADFLASDYIHDVQLTRSLQRHATGSARVIPLILRPANWRSAPFGHLSPLPREGKAIDTWQHKDEAWLDVASGIERIVGESRQGLSLAADNASLQDELTSVLARERELLLQRDALEKELIPLRAMHRHFDVEVETATTELRAATRAAQAQISELTARLGEALRDLEFHRSRADTLSSQRQERLSQGGRVNDELKELRTARDLLTWKAEAQLYVVSGGHQDDSSEKFSVAWTLAVENVGRHAVRLVEAQIVWCFIDPNDSSALPMDLQSEPQVLTFTERPVVKPGETSDAYLVKVNTKDLDAEHAKALIKTIRPRVCVVYEGASSAHRSSSERLLESENRMGD